MWDVIAAIVLGRMAARLIFSLIPIAAVFAIWRGVGTGWTIVLFIVFSLIAGWIKSRRRR